MDLRRRTSTSSSVARKRDRSLFVKGGGPPMASPPARRSAMIALVAIAEPIELGVNGLPFGAMTLAPALRQRSASRISAVMPTAVELARYAIQSSAASTQDPTPLRVTRGWTGQRLILL